MQKIVVITGARGIAADVIERMIKKEYKVIAITKTDAASIPSSCSRYVADITDEAKVKEVLHQIDQEFGRIDALINNAGVGHWKTVEDMTSEEFDDQMQTNVKGVFLMSKYAIPLLRKSSQGHIIHVASDLSYTSRPKASAYCASKWALLGFAGSLKLELAEDGIAVSTVAPGLVQTDFGGVPKEKKEHGLLPEEVGAYIDLLVEANGTSQEIIIRPKPLT
ncbi:SDR family oxidoreductase [Paenalkalicoccus suaedae]|uniref:SDR family oxidoreductase n=1 Tax=Paenalkalicoccus suaedae TaxID=2592382 RepID=A0A859FEH1_9BACI|nr:SDR family oxidoreductase [Paenalkalicoccus suaedae]QKS71270.1 SDR family oxidoreductase [Paenalkalicoccus suaedae]